MATNAKTYPVGRGKRIFVKTQTAIGVSPDAPVATTTHIAAGDGIKADETGLTITPVHVSTKRVESQEGRDPIGTVAQERGPHTFTYADYARPSGTAGTVPDIDPMLLSFLLKITSPSWEITGVTSDSIFTADISGAGYGEPAVDDIVLIPFELGGTTGETAMIDTLETVSGVTTITLWHDLTFTPTVGTVISASVQYAPLADVDTTKFYTLKQCDGGAAQTLVGCQSNEMSLSVTRGESARLTISGLAKHHSGFGQTTLDGEISAVATTMTIANPLMAWGIESDTPEFVWIDDEVVKITDHVIATGVCTIVREQKGTSGAIHADGTAVTYWDTTPTTSGTPISGVKNSVRFGGTAFAASELSFGLNEGAEPVSSAGDDELTTFVFPAQRDTTVAGVLIGHKNDFQAIGLAEQRTTIDIMQQYGETVGKTIAFFAPEVLLNPIELEGGAEGKIAVPISSMAVTDSEDNDIGFRIAIC